MTTAPTTPTLPIAKLKVAGDVNPRQDLNDGTLAELAASIKEHGVLQPLLVRPNGDGYEVVAGARRLAAAKKAGLKDVPVHHADLNGGALAAAIVENVIREDLTPVEEAEALHALQEVEKLSLRDLGKRVGKSKDYVAQRLRIRELPDKAKAAIGGTLAMHEIPVVLKVAKLAPAAAEHLATAGVDLEDEWRLGNVLRELARDGKAGLWSDHPRPSTLPIEDGKQLEARYKKATGVTHYYGSDTVALENEDINAARAFGCLLEIGHYHFITDGTWLTAQVRAIVELEEKRAAKKAGEKSAPAPTGKAAEAKAKEQRKKAREAEERKRTTARGHNLELGVKTAKAFKAPKLTLDVVKLLALLAVDNQEDGLGKRGLRYVDEQLQTVETKKDGKQKISYPQTVDGARLISKAIDQAKTPEEVAGVVLRAYVCATYASEDVVADSSRAYFIPRGAYEPKIKKLVEKIAAKVVPPALKRGRR